MKEFNFMNECLRTESTVFAVEESGMNVNHLETALNMHVEFAEYADAVKKMVFYGKELDLSNFARVAGAPMQRLVHEQISFGSLRFVIPPNDDMKRLIHAALGFQTEAAEFTKAIYEHIFMGKELDIVNLREEMGDMMWYMAIAMDVLNTTFSDEQSRVINKLRARYPEKFTEYDAEHRDLEAERMILEHPNQATLLTVDVDE